MIAKVNDELHEAAEAQADFPVAVEHEPTRKVYYLYNEELHLRACKALRELDDLESIRAGIEDMEAGRVTPVAEADAMLRARLGFPSKAQ